MKKLILFIIFITTYIHSQTYDMKINLKDGTIVFFSVDDIKKITFDDFTGINNSNSDVVIESFKLFQNYPNPFNPSTTITYQIPDNSNVSVNIYDINGQLIKELLYEYQSAGEYNVTWDGTNQSNLNVASGVYIYTVRCNEILLSKHMILLK